MALVKYVGPHRPGVAVPYGLGEIEATYGEPVDVPDDLARGLLGQPSNWEAVQPAKPAPASKNTTEEDDA